MNQPVWSLSNHLKLKKNVRRTVVVFIYAVYISLLTYWTYLPGELFGIRLAAVQWLTVTGVVLFLAGFSVLYASTERLADRFQRPFHAQPALDERQLFLRNRAYFWSYLIFGVSIFFAWTTLTGLNWFGIFMVFSGLYVSLPTAIVAWLEPDPVPNV